MKKLENMKITNEWLYQLWLLFDLLLELLPLAEVGGEFEF